MKTTFALLMILLLSPFSIAQETPFFQAYHPETGETYLIESGKVVRVVNNEGKRFKGRLNIVDDNTIIVKGHSLLLTDIDKIKKMRNVWVYVLGAFTVYYGIAMAGVGILIAALGDYVALGVALSAAGVGLTYLGINGINPARGFKSFQGWQYSIVTSSDLQPRVNSR